MAHKENLASNLASRFEGLAAAARQLEQLLKDFPELEAGLRASFATQSESATAFGNGHASKGHIRRISLTSSNKPQKGDSTNLEKLAEFFVRTGNKPITTPEIGEKSGLDQHEVTNVLWSSRAVRTFEKLIHPTNKKTKMWRLREDVYAKREKAQEQGK